MKSKNYFSLSICLVLLVSMIASCQGDIADDSHYKVPNWLKGNAYEVLQKEGNHTIFLRGIDLSGYKSIVNGNSILTVMAPNDDSFTSFLNKKGYSSIDDMYAKDPQYLTKLITFHLMYYSFDWSKLVNFRPDYGDGATDEQKAVGAGYYYKHRTKSADPVTIEKGLLISSATPNTIVDIPVYHYERYLPVFSNKLFETKGIDAKYNYEYFYPNSTWTGGNHPDGGFNVSNASVSDTANVVTDNGYLYNINQVLEPLETIYTVMKNNSKYSDFFNLYNQYGDYVAAPDEINAKLGYTAYLHDHGSLPSIAYEWPTTSSLAFSSLEKYGYNIFAPSNTAIDNFFKNYWTSGCGYSSIQNLDPLILYFFIMQSFANVNNESFLAFPEEIKKGNVLTAYGTAINIDPDQVTDRVMCENGTFYGMDNMNMPAIFTSVVGPAFKDARYVDYLYALSGSSLVLSLASNKSQFVTLVPDTAQFTAAQMRLENVTSGKQLQTWSDDAGTYVQMSTSAMRNLVNMHTASNVSELKTTGTQIVESNIAFNYWYVYNGKITTNALFNQQLNPAYQDDPFVKLEEITNNGNAWDNGRSYSYKYPGVYSNATGDGLAYALSICNDKTYPYYLFSQLLQKSGLVATNTLNTSILPTLDTRFVCFVPTNSAIRNSIANIPGCSGLKVADDNTVSGTITSANKTKLANYLRSYFITSTMNTITTYPYPGSSMKGDFYTTGTNKMNISEDSGNLYVKLIGGTATGPTAVNSKYHYLPFAFADGCFHFIDDILQ